MVKYTTKKQQQKSKDSDDKKFTVSPVILGSPNLCDNTLGSPERANISSDYKYFKTPIPSATTLGAPGLCEAHLTEMIQNVCSCGRSLGIITYKFSKFLSNGGSFSDFANNEKLSMCCRNNVLSPAIVNIVTADKGARRISGVRDKITDEFESLELSDKPEPSFYDSIAIPPITDLYEKSQKSQQP
jgi:hypothetical protein